MRKFYVGQRPLGSIKFNIVDEHKQPVEALRYFTAKVMWRRPDGSVYSDGIAIPCFDYIDYRFGETSPFTMPGEYQVQIRLSTDWAEYTDMPFDYTDIIAIDVIESLEGS